MKNNFYTSLSNHVNDGVLSFLYISCAVKPPVPHASVRPQRRL